MSTKRGWQTGPADGVDWVSDGRNPTCLWTFARRSSILRPRIASAMRPIPRLSGVGSCDAQSGRPRARWRPAARRDEDHMHSPTGPQAARKPASKKSVEPTFPALATMPGTLDELFRSVAVTVRTAVSQPSLKGDKPAKKQTYALPWAGYGGWRDARNRLHYFERVFQGKLAWAPFNDSDSNDGPMSLNAVPGRAFIE